MGPVDREVECRYSVSVISVCTLRGFLVPMVTMHEPCTVQCNPSPQAGQQQHQPQMQLQREDEPVDVVEEFEYLGSTVASDCELDKISAQIRKASNSFRSPSRGRGV